MSERLRAFAAVWLFGETLTLEYADELLAQYHVAIDPDEKHLRYVTEPRLFEHRYPSPQLVLREAPDGEWPLAFRLQPPRPRRSPPVELDDFDLAQPALSVPRSKQVERLHWGAGV